MGRPFQGNCIHPRTKKKEDGTNWCFACHQTLEEKPVKKKKFSRQQDKRWFAMKDKRKKDIEKYGKAYVSPPVYPVRRYDGEGNFIDEINP